MQASGWTLSSESDGEVLLVTVDMPVITPGTMRAVRRLLMAAIEDDGAHAVVIDLRGARPDLHEPFWLRSAEASAQAGLRHPVAFIVDLAHMDVAVQYCFAVAAYGLRRMAFTQLDRAFSWVHGLSEPLPLPDAPEPHPSPLPPSPRLRLVS